MEQQNMGVNTQGAMPQAPSTSPAAGQGGIDQAVQRTLLTRFSQLSDEEAGMFAELIDEETLPVLEKLFPELNMLFQKAMSIKGQSGGQEYIKPRAPQAQPMQGQAPVMQDGVSRGLVG